jgi:MOSC domain-containing protein YiiM
MRKIEMHNKPRAMNLLSINVGLPREIQWQGRLVRTSIFKSPVSGHVRVSKLNLEGDQQSDLSVHGGLYKAVYAYPSEHYEFWRKEVPGVDLSWGGFGENLTTLGMLEEEVRIGDRLRIGSAEFVITQPRMPCLKLGIRFGRPDMVKRFLHSGRSGFYLAVLEEGQIAAGGSIEILTRDEHGVTIADIVSLYQADATNQELLRKASDLPALPPDWRDHFRKRLWTADG